LNQREERYQRYLLEYQAQTEFIEKKKNISGATLRAKYSPGTGATQASGTPARRDPPGSAGAQALAAPPSRYGFAFWGAGAAHALVERGLR